MRIVEARVESRAWRVDAANARQRWTTREGRLVRLTDDAGHEGLGEASPLPGYSDDTLAEVEADLTGLTDRLAMPFAAAGTAPLADEIATRVRPLASPAARFAVECALWDLWARRQRAPLAALWGAKPGVRVRTATLVDPLEPRRASEPSPAAIKIKMGRPGRWRDELAGLRALARLEPPTPIRVDLNGAFSAAETAARLSELASLAERGVRIEFVEEPSFEAWPRSAPVPLARDESLRALAGPEDPAWAATAADVAAVVLKPTVLGGLQACTRWLGAGAKPVVSHTFEGPVAHAAAAAWALACAPEVVAGLGRHPGVDAWPDLAPGHLEAGDLVTPEGPGLGLRGAR